MCYEIIHTVAGLAYIELLYGNITTKSVLIDVTRNHKLS